MAFDSPPMADGPRPRRAFFRFVPFGRVDIAGLAAWGVLLAVSDLVWLHVLAVPRAVSGNVNRSFVLWVTLQALLCVLGGVFQETRKRPRWEVLVVGFIAAALIAIIALGVGNATADSNTGTTECSRQSPCDTSYGIGGILIMGITVPFYVGITAMGRGLAIVITRLRR